MGVEKMLNFNEEHKGIDLSTIKSKTKKVRNTGKVLLCGVMLSEVLLLSGCEGELFPTYEPTEYTQTAQTNDSITAIIMENGNAMVVDLQSYDKYISEIGSSHYDDYARDRTWVLNTSTGDKLLVDFDSVKFIEGENSHEKAEFIAQSLISENGQIICYDEVESYGRTK